jgi:hypothetical protein
MVTAGSLFFTVVPLYQKAVLEESLARREVELKKAETTLEGQYAKIRSFYVFGFININSQHCAGLMISPVLPDSGVGAIKDTAEEPLAIDPKTCLIEALEKSGITRHLRANDAAQFSLAVRAAADELSPIKIEAKAQLKLLLAKVERGSISDSVLPENSKRMLELAARLSGASDTIRVRRQKKMLSQHVKSLVIESYRMKLREKISTIGDTKWTPASKQ